MRLALIALLVGCTTLEPVPITGAPNVDGDSDPEPDTDPDVDPDPDSDTPTPTPTPTPPPSNGLVCDEPYATPDPNAGGTECVTEYVECGDSIYATVTGGTSLYDYDFWFEMQELGALVNQPDLVEGSERVYVLQGIFPGQFVDVRVESCDDVWASYLVTGDLTDVCEDEPTNAPRGHFYSNAGMSRRDQQRVLENTAVGVWDVQFMVDSPPGSDSNYLITFECGNAQ